MHGLVCRFGGMSSLKGYAVVHLIPAGRDIIDDPTVITSRVVMFEPTICPSVYSMAPGMASDCASHSNDTPLLVLDQFRFHDVCL